MGNFFSSGSGADDLKDLVNRRDIPKKDLTDKQITEMLKLVAKGKDVTIVAIGGAVNTVLLHSRTATGDVDFFYNTKQKHADMSDIVQAAKDITKQEGLGDAWFNNHTAVFMDVSALPVTSCIICLHMFRALKKPWSLRCTRRR